MNNAIPKMTALEVREAIRNMPSAWGQVFIPEFTFGSLRIDALVVEVRKRWVRGFEIKVRREDFFQDTKWELYSQFCSALAIACPWGLIQPSEVKGPFGLLWVRPRAESEIAEIKWAKRIKRFQNRDALAWIWTYLRVIEAELPRVLAENESLRTSIRVMEESQRKAHQTKIV